MGSAVIFQKICPLMGLPLPLFTPCRNPRSFQHKLFKGKPIYFLLFTRFLLLAATTSSSLR
jgi:hypothetical protein